MKTIFSLFVFLAVIHSHSLSECYHHLPCYLSKKPSLPYVSHCQSLVSSVPYRAVKSIHFFPSTLFLFQASTITHPDYCDIFLTSFPAASLASSQFIFHCSLNNHLKIYVILKNLKYYNYIVSNTELSYYVWALSVV